MATVAAKAAASALAGKSIVTPLIHSQKVGVVVSAGKMSRAVKVRVAGHEWNKKFRKVGFPYPKRLSTIPKASMMLITTPALPLRNHTPSPRPKQLPRRRRHRAHNLGPPHLHPNPPRRNRHRRPFRRARREPSSSTLPSAIRRTAHPGTTAERCEKCGEGTGNKCTAVT